MSIRSATFVKGVVGPDELLEDGRPQVAFIGRSNVGKSSTINALVGAEGLARTSSRPGRTTELNVYLVDRSYYLLDLPGIGYASMSKRDSQKLRQLIEWYLFESSCTPRHVVVILDANTGATKADLELLLALERRRHHVIVVANKVDALKASALQRALRDIQLQVGEHEVIPFSAKKRIGVGALRNALLR